MKGRVVVVFSIALMVAMFIVACEKQLPIKAESESEQIENMKITIGDQGFTVELSETDAAQALVQQLPLTLDMSELNGNEKYTYLADRLETNPSVPASIHAGDLMLYGSNCLYYFMKIFQHHIVIRQ